MFFGGYVSLIYITYSEYITYSVTKWIFSFFQNHKNYSSPMYFIYLPSFCSKPVWLTKGKSVTWKFIIFSKSVLLLFSIEVKVRFRTLGWVNDNIIVIFRWTIPLNTFSNWKSVLDVPLMIFVIVGLGIESENSYERVYL